MDWIESLPTHPRLQIAAEHIPCVSEENGTLTINVLPGDAKIELPNLEMTYHPRMSVPACSVRILAHKPGYKSKDQTVQVSGDTQIDIELQRLATGTLTLDLSPDDAQVELTTLDIPYLPGMMVPTGQLPLVVRRKGYFEEEQVLNVIGDTRKRIVLKRLPSGTLTLDLLPSDAQVDLPSLGKSYQPGMEVPSGSLPLVVRRQGYLEAEQTVNVRGDTTARIELERLSWGTLTLDLFPRDAEVKLPDLQQDYQPKMKLPAGDVSVAVRRRGYETAKRTIQVVGDTRALIELELRSTGTLTIDVFPADSSLKLLDTEESYRSGMTLPVGPVRVLATREGYKAVTQTIEVVGDVLAKLELEQLPSGTLTLNLSPMDATVDLPDIGKSFWQGMPLAQGPHRVIARHEDYEDLEQVIEVSGDTKHQLELAPRRNCTPVLISSAKPKYPEHMALANVEGYVDVTYEVRASGSVHNPRVLNAVPSGSFNQAALDAIQRFRYRLPRSECRGVEKTDKILRFRFELDKR